MLIHSKKELHFCIAADRMMNRGYFSLSLKRRIRNLICPDYVMDYIVAMRKYNYYKQTRSYVLANIYKRRFLKIGALLGFSIGDECFDYGLVVMHPGTIVVGQSNRIGRYANINTSTCIVDNGSKIGDFLFLSTGAKIISNVQLPNNTMIGANSVVLNGKDDDLGGVFVGSPAQFKRQCKPWYLEKGYSGDKRWAERINAIEKLKKELSIIR